MRGERVDAERVVVARQERQDVVDPVLHVGLAHPQRELLVEDLQHVERIRGAAVDAGERDRPAAPDDVDREVERAQAVDAGGLHDLAGDRVGHQPGERVRELAARRAVRLHADRVDDRVRPAAVGELAHRAGHAVGAADVDRPHAVALRAGEPLGHEVEPDDQLGAEVLGDAARHLADRAEADDGDAAALRDLGVADGLPRGGQHVGEEQEAVVGRAVGDLDRPVLGLRDAQQLGLAAGDLAVELRVAEQRGAHALVADLRRLALRLQPVVAHEAVPAGDVERDDHPVADGDVRQPRRRRPRRRPSARGRGRRPRR